jgi:ethanolamine ammonia-lyase large subunit
MSLPELLAKASPARSGDEERVRARMRLADVTLARLVRNRRGMNLRELLAKASPARSGDELAGLVAATARVRARMQLADVPPATFRNTDHTGIRRGRERGKG